MAEVAFQALLPHLREKYDSQDFESISQIVQRMSGEVRSYEPRKSNYTKKVNYVNASDSSDWEDDEYAIGLAEWVKTKKPVSCPYGKREPEKFGFDITKADKIFYLLLA